MHTYSTRARPSPHALRSTTRLPRSFGDDDQQHQYHDQHDNDGQAPVLLGLPAEAIQPAPRSPELRVVAINALLDLVEKHDLVVELVAYLHAELPLPADARAQLVELLVLLAYHLAVVLVNLLVRELRVVRRGILVRGVVAVGEESGAVGVLVVVVGVVLGRGRGVVCEAHGFGDGAGLLLGSGEVGG